MSVEGPDSETERKEAAEQRQDAYVIFSNEKDLRHFESIRIKSQLYTGIAVRTKFMTPQAMDNLLHAIELDGGQEQPGKALRLKAEQKEEATGKTETLETEPEVAQARPKGCIINLRFEECRVTRKATARLCEFLRRKQILETIGFCRVSFEDYTDFKKIMEGI